MEFLSSDITEVILSKAYYLSPIGHIMSAMPIRGKITKTDPEGEGKDQCLIG